MHAARGWDLTRPEAPTTHSPRRWLAERMLTGSAVLTLLLFVHDPAPATRLPARPRSPPPSLPRCRTAAPVPAQRLAEKQSNCGTQQLQLERSCRTSRAYSRTHIHAHTHTRTHLHARARAHTHTHTHTALLPDIEEHVTKGPRTRAAGAAAGTPRSALSCALDERVCTHLVRLLVLCHRAGREAADDGAALEPVWLLARVCRIHIRVCESE